MVHPAVDTDGSTNHAGTKKAASISLKPRKFITVWFDNKRVATPCGTAEEHSAIHPKISINILIAKVGLSPVSLRL